MRAKTASANTDEGSLGATVDLITARSFAYETNRFAVSAQDAYYEDGGKWLPRSSSFKEEPMKLSSIVGVLVLATGVTSAAEDTQRGIEVGGDPHPVAKYRVIGSLSNLPEFQRAFECKADAKMVRSAQERCDVW